MDGSAPVVFDHVGSQSLFRFSDAAEFLGDDLAPSHHRGMRPPEKGLRPANPYFAAWMVCRVVLGLYGGVDVVPKGGEGMVGLVVGGHFGSRPGSGLQRVVVYYQVN